MRLRSSSYLLLSSSIFAGCTASRYYTTSKHRIHANVKEKEFTIKLGEAEQSPAKAELEKLEIVRNGRQAGDGWPAKISTATLNISSYFFRAHRHFKLHYKGNLFFDVRI